jgi:predicted dehydrogenase
MVYKQINQINIKWIHSRTFWKTQQFAQSYKKLIAIENLDSFLKKKHKLVDGVLVLVSADQISKVSIKIAKYRIPMFIEKPIGLNMREVIKIKNILNKNKIKNLIGFNRRCYSNFQYIKKNSKKFGQLCGFKIECNERYWFLKKIIKKKLLQNWLYVNSCHVIDLMTFLFGDLVSIKKISSKGTGSFIDKFVSILKFKKNIIGSVNFFSTSPGGWRITVYYKKMTAVFDNLEKGYLLDRNFKSKIIPISKYDQKYKPGFYLQSQYFLNLLKNKYKKNNFSDVNSAFKTFSIVEKFLK